MSRELDETALDALARALAPRVAALLQVTKPDPEEDDVLDEILDEIGYERVAE